MLFLSRVPGAPLDLFIESIWLYQNDPRPHALERVLPSGAAQLIVNLNEDATRVYHADGITSTSGTVLSGVQSHYCVIDTAEQEHVLGVTFKPGGTAPFFRVPAHETSDADTPLDALWGLRGVEVREQVLEAAAPEAKLDAMERALAQMFRFAVPHPAVTFALNSFTRRPLDASISAVTDRIALSPKRFIEHFKFAVGVAPKQYCRILRFQRALAGAERGDRVDWTRVAVESGYFDQAHFIRDFRSFAGITPTMYQNARTEFRNHVKFVQSEAAAAVR